MDATGIGTIQLRLDNDHRSVRLVRAVLRRLVDFQSDEDEQAMLIALSEIFANAVDEHDRLGVDDPVEMTMRFGAGGGMTITDRGRGLDDTAGSAVPDPVAVSGRGLPIARALVPELRIAATALGTAITLPWPKGSRPSTAVLPNDDGER